MIIYQKPNDQESISYSVGRQSWYDTVAKFSKGILKKPVMLSSIVNYCELEVNDDELQRFTSRLIHSISPISKCYCYSYGHLNQV